MYILLLTLLVLFLSACRDDKTAESDIKVFVGDQKLQAITYENVDDVPITEIVEIHKKVIGDGWEHLPYILLGESISVEIKNTDVKEIEVIDFILNKIGEIKFKYAEMGESTVIPVKDGKASFTLQPNRAIYLSSNTEDYSLGNVIRCFIVRTKNNDISSSVYAFILQTDPE